jgi:2'-5' RNA ligase
MIPHLTLAMGVISPDHTIDDVISLTRELVAKHPKPVNPCTLETLYLENVRGKYVFADIRPNSDFSTLKYHFEQAMLGTVLKSEDEYSATPHITLGHAESKQDEVQKLLTHIELPRQCGFSSVAVGEAGPKGTVISNIKTFKWQ